MHYMIKNSRKRSFRPAIFWYGWHAEHFEEYWFQFWDFFENIKFRTIISTSVQLGFQNNFNSKKLLSIVSQTVFFIISYSMYYVLFFLKQNFNQTCFCQEKFFPIEYSKEFSQTTLDQIIFSNMFSTHFSHEHPQVIQEYVISGRYSLNFANHDFPFLARYLFSEQIDVTFSQKWYSTKYSEEIVFFSQICFTRVPFWQFFSSAAFSIFFWFVKGFNYNFFSTMIFSRRDSPIFPKTLLNLSHPKLLVFFLSVCSQNCIFIGTGFL